MYEERPRPGVSENDERPTPAAVAIMMTIVNTSSQQSVKNTRRLVKKVATGLFSLLNTLSRCVRNLDLCVSGCSVGSIIFSLIGASIVLFVVERTSLVAVFTRR